MGYYWKPTQRAIDDFFEWLFADKRTKKMLSRVPRGCRHCEVLGICRDEENDWKCHNGCMVLNWENERKYEGLPRGCWNCKYLTECRRPKEEGWKCYNGCRVVKEKESTKKK